uniref:Uncharacterized protein n=1 Tax=Photinus pyralis TaxID=7054 RepID=A0A1Y1KPI3_PHOPY
MAFKDPNSNLSQISQEGLRKIKSEYENLLQEIGRKGDVSETKQRTNSLTKGSQELYKVILEASALFAEELDETLRNAEVLKQQVPNSLKFQEKSPLKLSEVEYKSETGESKDWLSFIDHPEFFILLN